MNDPLTMLTCERKALRLTQGACSKLWKSANDKENRPQPWEGRFSCLGCPVGAAFNGTSIQPFQRAAELVRTVCSRCGPCDGRRLIGMDLCVSCYNRDQEAKRGRNRKGNRPKLCDILLLRDITVLRDGKREVVQQRAASHEEMMIRVVKHATGPVAFIRPVVATFRPQAIITFDPVPVMLCAAKFAQPRRKGVWRRQPDLDPQWPIIRRAVAA